MYEGVSKRLCHLSFLGRSESWATPGAPTLLPYSGVLLSLPKRWPSQADNVHYIPNRASPYYDLILLADTFWTQSLHQPLILTLTQLLRHSPSAIIHLAAGFHTGKDVVRSFFADAEEAGLVPLDEAGTWFELSSKGEKRAWLKSAAAGEENESQEERNRWTLLGALRRA
jgi:hypothetical protein